MTNYVNFKLSKDVEKNPGPTQYNIDHHEVIIRPIIQNHSSTMQLTCPISSENLMKSRLGELGLQSKDDGWGSIYERDNPVRFIESNTENSWLSRISG